MAEIARGTHLPIATGERVFTKWGFREVLEKRAATILQPDLCHAGGITEVPPDRRAWPRRITRPSPRTIRSARSRWRPACSSRRPSRTSSARSRSASARATSSNPFTVREGYLDLPTGPGLGIELDENALADKIGHDWRNQESYDADDGSVVDW